MKQNAKMVINRETAMLLWSKSFGKATKAKDFAGREIVKAAYDQRGSKYGWNVDHILPQSKGGKTVENNLICCHILTNDEKADKFPCFTANGKRFEIIKVQNHYEIREVGSSDDTQNADDSVNFYDSAAGIRFFKKLKGTQNQKVFVGIIVIKLTGVQTTAIIDFIEKIFDDKSIFFGLDGNAVVITIKDYHVRLKEDTVDNLDRCVLLNTYIKNYFIATQELDRYSIFYGEHIYSSKIDTLIRDNTFIGYLTNSLVINESVRNDTYAKDKDLSTIGRDKLGNAVYQYDYVFTKLKENLTKSI